MSQTYTLQHLREMANYFGYTLVPKDRIKTVCAVCDMASYSYQHDNVDVRIMTEKYLISQIAHEITSKLEEYKKLVIKEMGYDKGDMTTRMMAKFDIIVPTAIDDV